MARLIKILDLIPVIYTDEIKATIEDRRQLALGIWNETNGLVKLDIINVDKGPASIESAYDEYVSAPYILEKVRWAEESGYNAIIIDCFGDPALEFEGHEAKIFFKNENHIIWFDDKVLATNPDIVEVIDAKTGEPITNTDLREGMKVSVVGLKGRDQFRTPKGLEVLGPRHFGFDIDYVPIEKRVVDFPIIK